MATGHVPAGIEGLRGVFADFEREVTTRAPLVHPPLRAPLVARVLQAIDEGMPALEEEHARGGLDGVDGGAWADDGALVSALQRELDRRENPTLRWLLIAYWVILQDIDAIRTNVEALAVDSPDELTWLVAGALWVQWGSGQPTTAALRDSLSRLRARCPGFDAHVASALSSKQDGVAEAAALIRKLLTDPSATLPQKG